MMAASSLTSPNALTEFFSGMKRSNIEKDIRNKVREATISLHSTTRHYQHRYSEWTHKPSKPFDQNESERIYDVKNDSKPSIVNTTFSTSHLPPDVGIDKGLDDLDHVQLSAVHFNLNDPVEDVKTEIAKEPENAPRASQNNIKNAVKMKELQLRVDESESEMSKLQS